MSDCRFGVSPVNYPDPDPDDWAKILDNGGQVDTFILDFEKTFDTPPHENYLAVA